MYVCGLEKIIGWEAEHLWYNYDEDESSVCWKTMNYYYIIDTEVALLTIIMELIKWKLHHCH